VNPCSAQFDFAAVVFDGVGAPAKAVVGFDHHGSKPALLQITGGRDAREAAADHNNVPWAGHFDARTIGSIESCCYGC
jgi:hypothetical protein